MSRVLVLVEDGRVRVLTDDPAVQVLVVDRAAEADPCIEVQGEPVSLPALLEGLPVHDADVVDAAYRDVAGAMANDAVMADLSRQERMQVGHLRRTLS